MAIVASVLALLGTIVMTVAVVAMLRAGPFAEGANLNLSIHATSLMQVMGIPLVLCAVLAVPDPSLWLRALLVAAFSMLTSPLSTHALARLALERHRWHTACVDAGVETSRTKR